MRTFSSYYTDWMQYKCERLSRECSQENDWFYRIGDTPVVYDKDTHVMYYLFSKSGGNHAYGYMSPYYNEHGQMCYYVDGQVIPIEEVLIDAG